MRWGKKGNKKYKRIQKNQVEEKVLKSCFRASSLKDHFNCLHLNFKFSVIKIRYVYRYPQILAILKYVYKCIEKNNVTNYTKILIRIVCG